MQSSAKSHPRSKTNLHSQPLGCRVCPSCTSATILIVSNLGFRWEFFFSVKILVLEPERAEGWITGWKERSEKHMGECIMYTIPVQSLNASVEHPSSSHSLLPPPGFLSVYLILQFFDNYTQKPHKETHTLKTELACHCRDLEGKWVISVSKATMTQVLTAHISQSVLMNI